MLACVASFVCEHELERERERERRVAAVNTKQDTGATF